MDSLILTGSAGGLKPLEQMGQKIDTFEYEKFPFCCSHREKNSQEREKSFKPEKRSVEHDTSSELSFQNQKKVQNLTQQQRNLNNQQQPISQYYQQQQPRIKNQIQSTVSFGQKYNQQIQDQQEIKINLDENQDPFNKPRQSEITKIENISISRDSPFIDFWDEKRIDKCLELQVNHSQNSKLQQNWRSDQKYHQLNEIRYKVIQSKYEQIKNKLINDLNQEYKKSLKKADRITNDEFEEMKRQMNIDVAKQIFKEVNMYNEVGKIIDLSCLDSYEAIVLLNDHLINLCDFQTKIIQIVCDSNQIHTYQKNNKTYLHNDIVDHIQNQVGLDSFYVQKYKRVLVKLDQESYQLLHQQIRSTFRSTELSQN